MLVSATSEKLGRLIGLLSLASPTRTLFARRAFGGGADEADGVVWVVSGAGIWIVLAG